MKTAEELRTEATTLDQRAADSFDRCDTDGFLSQWSDGITARLRRAEAEVAEQGGTAEFDALFDLDGNLVAAKLIDTRYGTSWGILATDDPRSEIVAWVGAFPKRETTMTRKGYREGTVRAAAYAELWAPSSATGLGGCLNVSVVTRRKDGGFSRNVEVVSDGRTAAA